MILKKKYRYVLIMASRELNAAQDQNVINSELIRFVGETAYSQINPRIVAQYGDRMFVIKTYRGFEKQLILALSFMKRVNGSKIGLYTIKTSGSIKSLASYARQMA